MILFLIKLKNKKLWKIIGEDKKSKKRKQKKKKQLNDDKTLFERELKLIKEKAIEDTFRELF